MQIRKRNKNNQKRLYNVFLTYRVYDKERHFDKFIYRSKEISTCLTYAYNKNEAIKKAKYHLENKTYPEFYGYKLEYDEISVKYFKTLMTYHSTKI